MVGGMADRSWRWRDGGLAALLWFVPLTGLNGGVSLGRAVTSLVVGLLVGLVMSAPLSPVQAGMAKTATARRVGEAIWTAAAGVAVFALLGADSRSWLAAVISLAMMWVALAVSASISPLTVNRPDLDLDSVAWLPLPQRSPTSTAGKRAFDLIVSALALIVIAPLLVIVAVAVKANDRGPVFFRQRRVGHNGIEFEMFKFRSMVLNAEELKAELAESSDRVGPLFKMNNDPRITPIGRIIRGLSIDELPQLLNILRGEMSLVGPRPALPDEAAQFDAALQRRNAVTPGLTGLWQAEARSDPDFNRFRDLDLRYVSIASPALDLWIILATATEIVVSVAAVPLAAMGFDVAGSDGIDLRDKPEEVVIDLRESAGSTAPRPSAA